MFFFSIKKKSNLKCLIETFALKFFLILFHSSRFKSFRLKMDNLDPELARFIQQMEQSARMDLIKQKLTGECWDLCVSNANVSRFDSKTESCLSNCVERFIDTNVYVLDQFSKKGSSAASTSFSFDKDSELVLEDKFSSQSQTSYKSEETAKTKSGWKLW